MPLQRLSRRLNRIKRQSVWQYRQATNRFRALPHFIVIGAQKAGTTSLYYYLTQHPQISSSLSKEIHYFDGGVNSGEDNYQRGIAWYRSHFPLASTLGKGHITGEASPIYIYHPLVPERICRILPDVKMIAVLRNPTERAISHYFHQKRRGWETLPIEEALREEENRITPAIQRGDYQNDYFRRCSYKARGRYREQLERYFKYFNRDQLLVLSSEELFHEPKPTLDRVFEFLGVERAIDSIDLQAKNVAPDKSGVDARVYDYLDDYFAPENRALFKFIGKEFDWRRS